MDRKKAQQEFAEGRLHPSCPVCPGSTQLVVSKRMVRVGQVLRKAYACMACRTGFWAWVDG